MSSSNSIKQPLTTFGSYRHLVSPTISDDPQFLDLLLGLEQLGPLASRFRLCVDGSWEFREIVCTFLVSSNNGSSVLHSLIDSCCAMMTYQMVPPCGIVCGEVGTLMMDLRTRRFLRTYRQSHILPLGNQACTPDVLVK